MEAAVIIENVSKVYGQGEVQVHAQLIGRHVGRGGRRRDVPVLDPRPLLVGQRPVRAGRPLRLDPRVVPHQGQRARRVSP